MLCDLVSDLSRIEIVFNWILPLLFNLIMISVDSKLVDVKVYLLVPDPLAREKITGFICEVYLGLRILGSLVLVGICLADWVLKWVDHRAGVGQRSVNSFLLVLEFWQVI